MPSPSTPRAALPRAKRLKTAPCSLSGMPGPVSATSTRQKLSVRAADSVTRPPDGVWEGGSTSMFTPALKFTLFERFSPEALEVSEQMEMNGRRTFGYDEPILYKRV